MSVPAPSNVTAPIEVFSMVPPKLPIVNDLETFPVDDENLRVALLLDEPTLNELLAFPRLAPKLEMISVPLSIAIDLPAPPKVFVLESVKLPEPILVKL